MSGESPLRGTLAARDLLRQGRGTEAELALQDTEPTAERYFLAARIAQRRSFQEVIDIISEGRRIGAFFETEDAALASAIIACAYIGVGDAHQANAELSEVEKALIRTQQRGSEIVYYTAFAKWMMGETREAQNLLKSRSPRTAEMRARYQLLRGFCYAQFEQFTEQAVGTRAVLTMLLEQAPDEVALIANACHALAALAREIAYPCALEMLVDVERRLPWTKDLAFEHFQTLRGIGWSYALRGEYIRAILYLGRAKSVAVTPGQQMLAHLDHAQVARWANELHSSVAELQLADDCAAQIDWENAAQEEAVALIVAADLYADVDAGKANDYLMRARDVGGLRTSLALAHGDRVKAFMATAAARIAMAHDKQSAKAHAEVAYNLFASMQYVWRAARVALDLHTITESPKWLDRAKEHLAIYETNSLLDEVNRRTSSPDLSPRLKEVLALLREGLHSEEIAQRMNLSVNTVRTHEKRLRRILGVTRREHILTARQRIA